MTPSAKVNFDKFYDKFGGALKFASKMVLMIYV